MHTGGAGDNCVKESCLENGSRLKTKMRKEDLVSMARNGSWTKKVKHMGIELNAGTLDS